MYESTGTVNEKMLRGIKKFMMKFLVFLTILKLTFLGNIFLFILPKFAVKKIFELRWRGKA